MAFFGGFALIGSAPAGTSPAIQSQTPVDNALPSFLVASMLYELLFVHLYFVSHKETPRYRVT
jgi:hypothetical protein